MKICKSCFISKNPSDFSKNRNQCKDCILTKKRDFYQKNKSYYTTKHKFYYSLHSHKIKHQNWVRDLKKKYDLTEDAYWQLFNSQNGNCAICGKNQKEFETKLEVDHCHKTGKIRGLLCSHHNLMLGLAEDNVVYLQNAIKYLG